MTNQQNNTLINLMLNGKLVSHFNLDTEIMAKIFDKSFKWVYINESGDIRRTEKT